MKKRKRPDSGVIDALRALREQEWLKEQRGKEITEEILRNPTMMKEIDDGIIELEHGEVVKRRK